jgi:hypothetical protein
MLIADVRKIIRIFLLARSIWPKSLGGADIILSSFNCLVSSITRLIAILYDCVLEYFKAHSRLRYTEY